MCVCVLPYRGGAVAPFDTVNFPLNYGSNPGANPVSDREGCVGVGAVRLQKMCEDCDSKVSPPLQYWLCTPESQWQSRGRKVYLAGAARSPSVLDVDP